VGWKNKPVAVLLGLLLVHVLAHIDRNMLLGFSPQITHDLGLSNAQYGFLTGAVWMLSFGVMAIVMGSLADRFSRTRVMAFGVLVWSLCTAASGWADSFAQMAAARFFVATGEAALVPAAVSLLAELFAEGRRGTAMGVFFVGIPLGIGLSFVIAGATASALGWRQTFALLGATGAVLTVPLWLLPDRREPTARANAPSASGGAALPRQIRGVVDLLRYNVALRSTIAGFVLVHFAFAGLAFAQLWLVRERGFDAAGIAQKIGGLQILFGTLGAVVGGVAGDRLARSLRGGRAAVLALLVLLCAPLMLAYRLAEPGSPLFYVGMCAGFFLPLAAYGPASALMQALVPESMRSTVTGTAMMLINLFAIAAGNLAVGAISDRLAALGSQAPLSAVLIATDLLVFASLLLFALAALAASPKPTVPAPSQASTSR
jgi:MFS family permease